MSEEKRKVIGVLKSLIEFLEDEPGESPHPSPAATPSPKGEGFGTDSQGAGAEEARIMTQDEIIGWNGYIWIEFKGMKAMKAVLIEYGMHREPYEGDHPTKDLAWETYQVTWRAWTGQPTEKQRKVEAWKK